MFTKTSIENYFNAEKQYSLFLIIIGITGVLVALALFIFFKTTFCKGFAIPVCAIGLLMSIAGFAVYRRSDGDRIRNVYAYDMNPGDLKNRELRRMKIVMKNFVIYRYTEIILFIAGIVLYLYLGNMRHDFWRGLGLALAIMALLALVADYFAEKRGKTYIQGLEIFTAKF